MLDPEGTSVNERPNLEPSELDARLHESDGGYAYRAYRCVDRVAKGCETGTPPTVVDHTRDTAAQAWAQHLHTALGRQLSASETAPSDR